MWHVRRAGCYFMIEVWSLQLWPDGHVGTNLRQKHSETLVFTPEEDVSHYWTLLNMMCVLMTHISLQALSRSDEKTFQEMSPVSKKKMLRSFSYQKEINVSQRQRREKGFVTVIPSVCVLSNISALIAWHVTLCYCPFARQAVCQGLFIFFSSQKNVLPCLPGYDKK